MDADSLSIAEAMGILEERRRDLEVRLRELVTEAGVIRRDREDVERELHALAKALDALRQMP